MVVGGQGELHLSTDGDSVDIAHYDGEVCGSNEVVASSLILYLSYECEFTFDSLSYMLFVCIQYKENVPLRKEVIHLISRGGLDANRWLVGAEFDDEDTKIGMDSDNEKKSKVLKVCNKRGQTGGDSLGSSDDLQCVVERPDGTQETIPYNDILGMLFRLKRRQASDVAVWVWPVI